MRLTRGTPGGACTLASPYNSRHSIFQPGVKMARPHRSVLIAAALTALASPGPARGAAAPDTRPAAATSPAADARGADRDAADGIEAAVVRLGAANPRTREAATRELWAMGKAAEPALREAAEGFDPEVAARARSVLEDFRLGISPGASPVLVESIRLYRDGTPAERRQAMQSLSRSGRDGQRALLHLFAIAPDADTRQQLLNTINAFGTRSNVRTALAMGEDKAAESLLENGLSSTGGGGTARDYAAYLLLRGEAGARPPRSRSGRPPTPTRGRTCCSRRSTGAGGPARRPAGGGALRRHLAQGRPRPPGRGRRADGGVVRSDGPARPRPHSDGRRRQPGGRLPRRCRRPRRRPRSGRRRGEVGRRAPGRGVVGRRRRCCWPTGATTPSRCSAPPANTACCSTCSAPRSGTPRR